MKSNFILIFNILYSFIIVATAVVEVQTLILEEERSKI